MKPYPHYAAVHRSNKDNGMLTSGCYRPSPPPPLDAMLQVAPAARPDYYSAVIQRSGEGAAAGGATSASTSAAAAAGAGAAAAAGGGEREGNGGGADASPAGAGVVSQPQHGHAPGPAAALRAAPQGTPSPVLGGAPGVVGHPVSVGFAATAGSPASGAQQQQQQPPPSSSVSVQNQGASGVGAGVVGAGGRKGGVKVGPLAVGSSKSKGLSGDGKGAVIRMRGLPYRASKSEVMGFFKGCSIPEEGIAFVTRADGRVTGEAYVRFATREDAKMGIRKDREMMVRRGEGRGAEGSGGEGRGAEERGGGVRAGVGREGGGRGERLLIGVRLFAQTCFGRIELKSVCCVYRPLYLRRGNARLCKANEKRLLAGDFLSHLRWIPIEE